VSGETGAARLWRLLPISRFTERLGSISLARGQIVGEPEGRRSVNLRVMHIGYMFLHARIFPFRSGLPKALRKVTAPRAICPRHVGSLK
jgi:hypothetical protein